MIKLTVIASRDYTIGRTQSYRMIIRATLESPDEPGSSSSSSSSAGDPTNGLSDPRIFKVMDHQYGDLTVIEFLSVCQPRDILDLGPTGSPRRVDQIDLIVPSKDLADQMVEVLAQDVLELAEYQWGTKMRLLLSGGTV